MLEDCFPHVDRDKESTWRFCPKPMADDPVLWSFFFSLFESLFLDFLFLSLGSFLTFICSSQTSFHPVFSSGSHPVVLPVLSWPISFLCTSIWAAARHPSIRERESCSNPTSAITALSRSVFAYRHISAYWYVSGSGGEGVIKS